MEKDRLGVGWPPAARTKERDAWRCDMVEMRRWIDDRFRQMRKDKQWISVKGPSVKNLGKLLNNWRIFNPVGTRRLYRHGHEHPSPPPGQVTAMQRSD